MTRVLVFILCMIPLSAWAQVKVIHAGKLIDGTGEKVRHNVTITIEGNRITQVEDGFKKAPKDAQLINLKNRCVLPGLMDMHTHLAMELAPGSYSEKFGMDPQDYAFRAGFNARKTLLAGFTTVREVGSTHFMDVHLKRAIANGLVDGPRVFGAGTAIATTGGHADRTNGLNHALMGNPGPNEGVIDGPDDARKAVRYRYKKGADLIKITATGGVLSVAKNGQNPQFTSEELEALIETANDYGMMVAAHAHGLEGIRRAVSAGVTTIEHGTYLDEATMDLMIEKGTYLVPTLMAGWWVSKSEVNQHFPQVVRGKAITIGPVMKDSFSKVVAKGVKVAFGTDSGVSPHGDNAYEFVLMVEAGMKPMAALKSATSVTAELLGMADQLGTVEAGKLADLVAVEGDPLQDIQIMTDIRFVMKDGKVYKNK